MASLFSAVMKKSGQLLSKSVLVSSIFEEDDEQGGEDCLSEASSAEAA